MLLIVDIDGTLADYGKRSRAAGPEPKRHDKRRYVAWLKAVQDEERLSQDTVVPGMLELLSRLNDKTNIIVYLTAREEIYRSVTQEWLKDQNFPPGALLMRANGDWRATEDMKADKIGDIKQHYGDAHNYLVLDDDPTGRCSKRYKKLGCTHLKVMWNR